MTCSLTHDDGLLRYQRIVRKNISMFNFLSHAFQTLHCESLAGRSLVNQSYCVYGAYGLLANTRCLHRHLTPAYIHNAEMLRAAQSTTCGFSAWLPPTLVRSKKPSGAKVASSSKFCPTIGGARAKTKCSPHGTYHLPPKPKGWQVVCVSVGS